MGSVLNMEFTTPKLNPKSYLIIEERKIAS